LRLLTLIILASAVAGASVPVQQGRGEGQLTITMDVDLAVFNVTVTDGKGRHVSGLTQADFAVAEDGREQPITLFSAEEVPASVGLIIDNSGSMIDKNRQVAEAAVAFVGASHPEDELFVVNFNEHVYFGLPPTVPFTRSAFQLRAALQTAPTGLTALYDALAAGIEHLNKGSRQRKALVVFSDGGDNASKRPLDEVLQAARRSSATMYTIGFYDETNRDRNPPVLRQIAALSGGRAYFPRSLDDMDEVWRGIAGGIRSQYTIGYQSSNPAQDGAFRKVRITASRGRGLQVTTREGYFAKAGATAK
jgi:Ca-activated chloride channel family protein